MRDKFRKVYNNFNKEIKKRVMILTCRPRQNNLDDTAPSDTFYLFTSYIHAL